MNYGKVFIGDIRMIVLNEELEKIICQIVLGLFFALTGIVTTLGGFQLGILAIPVVIIAILGSINSVNLIDGMPGLSFQKRGCLLVLLPLLVVYMVTYLDQQQLFHHSYSFQDYV